MCEGKCGSLVHVDGDDVPGLELAARAKLVPARVGRHRDERAARRPRGIDRKRELGRSERATTRVLVNDEAGGEFPLSLTSLEREVRRSEQCVAEMLAVVRPAFDADAALVQEPPPTNQPRNSAASGASPNILRRGFSENRSRLSSTCGTVRQRTPKDTRTTDIKRVWVCSSAIR